MVSMAREGIHPPTTMSREHSAIRAARSQGVSSRVLTRRAAVIVAATAVMLVATLDVPGTTAVASASLRWRATYDGPASQADAATAIGIAPSGRRVFVTGSSDASTGRARLATVAYDATTGAMRWVARELTAGDGFVNDIVAGSGRVFIAGGGRRSMLTVAYDGTSGARSWSSAYPVRGYVGATAVAVGPSLGGVVVTGGVPMTTIAYAPATGRRLWKASRPGSGTDVAVSRRDGTSTLSAPRNVRRSRSPTGRATDTSCGTARFAGSRSSVPRGPRTRWRSPLMEA